ncbi:hypothetical protein L1987_25995 [Smallanthus sonchifolius]|uniref:Uncharacterized protein n=1 Tax=Smallanthus sonchifolius TaxID=185202 RepID=A0ACB9I9T6_9ASTR|nr:hypothetical protein L1987_25995 [Smallanthus sonchifolius]
MCMYPVICNVVFEHTQLVIMEWMLWASGFSASSTAEDVTQGIDGTGLTSIVTGATSGIGFETTHVLASHGVHVVMAVRNTKSGKKVKEAIVNEIPTAKVDVMELDLSSLASVRKFAAEFISSSLPLNILIYNPIYAYGQSKPANILHAKELTKHFKESGVNITANALHPGSIAINLLRYHNIINGENPDPSKLVYLHHFTGFFVQNLALFLIQGAATTCYVSLHPQIKGVSGEYFMDNNIAQPNSYAMNAELAKELWDISLTMVAP